MRTIGVNEKLVDLIQQPINPEFLAYVSHQASLVIPCHETATDNKRRKDPLPPLATFIAVLVKRSNIRTGTLLGSLVFLNRLQQRLANIAKGMSCTCHRIFLATLIVTSKAIHDTSPKNKHWTRYAIFFSLGEVNLMEKQLLSLIDYQTVIKMDELNFVFNQFQQSLHAPKSSIYHMSLPPSPPCLSQSTISIPNDPSRPVLEMPAIARVASTSAQKVEPIVTGARLPHLYPTMTSASSLHSSLSSSSLSPSSLLSIDNGSLTSLSSSESLADRADNLTPTYSKEPVLFYAPAHLRETLQIPVPTRTKYPTQITSYQSDLPPLPSTSKSVAPDNTKHADAVHANNLNYLSLGFSPSSKPYTYLPPPLS